MRKISFALSALFVLGLAPLAFADVIPDGMEGVDLCDKISNLAEFPDYSLIILDQYVGMGDIKVAPIKPDECTPTFYKFDTTGSYAVLKSGFPTDDYSGIKSFDDSRLIPLSVEFSRGYKYVDMPNTIKSVTTLYSIKSIDSKLATLTKTEEITADKEGKITTKNFVETSKKEKPSPQTSFPDVSANHPFVEGISYVKVKNYVQGYPDGTYKPDQAINRAEFVKILIGTRYTAEDRTQCLAEEIKPEWLYAFFPDVPKSAWYSEYVCIAKSKDVIKGYPDGTFEPNATINMAEAYKIVLSTMVGPFEEVGQPTWYAPYFNFASENGLNLYPTLDPAKAVTRGEMAELIRKVESR
jgi:hypothetical protein